MFIEKFPNEIFSERILDLFIKIGKIVISAEAFGNLNQKSKRNFIHTILLNEKIISKFAEEYQTKLWEVILNLFGAKENLLRMKNFL